MMNYNLCNECANTAECSAKNPEAACVGFEAPTPFTVKFRAHARNAEALAAIRNTLPKQVKRRAKK